MKILYKCKKNHWASWSGKKDKKRTEAYYLELEKEELNDELKLLLENQKEQMEYQLKKFNKLFVIISKDYDYAFFVPYSYGPNWPISGHWDMSDFFIDMNGLIINNIYELKNLI